MRIALCPVLQEHPPTFSVLIVFDCQAGTNEHHKVDQQKRHKQAQGSDGSILLNKASKVNDDDQRFAGFSCSRRHTTNCIAEIASAGFT